MEVVIAGGGIGGLTLALALEKAGIRSRVFESSPEIRPVGVGINLLPHATRELDRLGLSAALERAAVQTREAVFFNRFGQLIYREPLGRWGGYEWPQISIHRGDLHQVLLDAVRLRLGGDCVQTGWKCIGFEQDAGGASALFKSSVTGEELPPQRGTVVVACDGIHSVIRKQLFPDEGEPLYTGVNMWRGVTRWPPVLSGASLVRAGWLTCGKMVIYPIRERIDAEGRQLVNWVAEIETPRHLGRDWSRRGMLEDFIGAFQDWHFDWLDVPAFLRAADQMLEFPMVDQEPLPWWTQGRVTLLGDAAHPMVPRGSNGAGQAILDARALADALAAHADPCQALLEYEARRREVTARVVRMNRKNPPDAILREVFLRSGDKPFDRIEDVIGLDELKAISEGYQRVAGYDRESLGSAVPDGGG
ncbi:MAG TPA: flavin-dependent oxidoreductase [Myxococcales bacterium]|nr:flavin-dependent oxidoreductase [Myxococcales bacterium]